MFTSTGPLEGVVTLELAGDIDVAVVDDLIAGSRACLEIVGVTTLVVDLAAVTFLDSSGLGALVRARNVADEQGVGLVIANVPASIMKVFMLTGLDAVLTFVHTDSNEADLGGHAADRAADD